MARVCMVAYTIYPSDNRIRREAEALVQRGDQVDVICPRCPQLTGPTLLAGVQVYPLMEFKRASGTGPIDYLLHYVAHLAVFVLAANVRIARVHRRHRYDVVHVHSMPDFLVFAALAAKLLGAKVVLDLHDLMPELYVSKFGMPKSHWLIRLIAAVERLSVAFADHAIAVHRPHLEAVTARGNPVEKFTVLMNLPDAARFAPSNGRARSRRFRLIYHGTVASRHGLDVAIRAVARAREQIQDLELSIIGDGDDFPRIRALVDQLGVEDIVRLQQGFLATEDLIAELQGADVGVVPILDDAFTRFMLPVKLLEYVGMGIPVIASRTETIEYYFDEDAVCLCSPGDEDELAGRIVELYRDRARREALARNAASFNRQHNWEREKQKYYELLDSLAAPRSQTTPPRLTGLSATLPPRANRDEVGLR